MPAGRSGNTAIVLTRVLNLGSRSVRRRRPSPVRVGPNRWPTGGQLLLISRFARGPRDAGGCSPAPRRAPRGPRGPTTDRDSRQRLDWVVTPRGTARSRCQCWSSPTGWTSELRLERNLTIRSDPDPGARIGHTIAVDIEGDEAVEALAGVRVDQASLDAAHKTVAYEQHLVVGAQHELRPGGRVVRVLAGVGAFMGERRC